MITLTRRIELEDIVLQKDVWKQVLNNAPCYFQAKYGKVFWVGIDTVPEDVDVMLDVVDVRIQKVYLIGLKRP